MNEESNKLNRRSFLKTAAGVTLGAAIPSGISTAQQTGQNSLQVWSCGGLAEALIPAHKLFQEKTGVEVSYTGAFAAALGKSLLGSASTEVFCGRVLDLAKKLRASDKMVSFKHLCFTSYVIVTPPGNPAGIKAIEDLAKPGVKVILSPGASPPGGDAAMGILKKAGIYEEVMQNCIIKSSCVQRAMKTLVDGKGDASVVEKRLTRMSLFKDRSEIIPIPEKFFPPGPLTFTIGIMKYAKDPKLAANYVNFIRSEEGQNFFEAAGFIPSTSAKGRELVEKLGVQDA